jgi:hypothetical protein
MNSGLLTIDTDGNGIYTDGANVIINGGTLNIDADSYGISTGSDYNSETVTQNGGELSIYCSGYGIYTSKIRINGGKMSVKSTGIMVFGTTDVKWDDEIVFMVSDSLDESQLAPLAPKKLPTGKKYVKTETPDFTKLPNDGEVGIGETMTVTWATNFIPVKLVLVEADEVTSTKLPDPTVTSLKLGAGYRYLYAYYTETKYVSCAILITEPFGFIKQPESGTTGTNGKLTVTWELNFDPAALLLVHHFGDDMTFEELTTSISSGSR